MTSSANPGAAASLLASSAAGYLQLVRLGIAVAPGYPLHAQGTTPQLRLQQDAGNYADFGVGATGNLTLTPSGSSLLIPGTKTLASADWASQTTGWGIYPESTHGRSGYADFRYLYADELHVKMFIADLEQALAGGQIIAKSVAILAADFTIPAKGSAATLRVEDLPGTTAAVFVSGDWVRIRNISRSGGGLVVADAYGTVGSATLNGDGTQSYTWTRPAGDTGSAAGGTVVLKGGLAIDYGVSGNGYWEVTTLDPAGSPYAQVATWATHPQNLTVRLRLGNLDGIAGIGAEWGLWAGQDATHYVKVSSAGAEIKGLTQTWIDSAGNARGMVDPSAGAGDYLFWLGPSSGDKRFAVNGAGTVYIGSVPSENVAGWAHASDLTKIDGGDIYAYSVTAGALTVNTWNEMPNPGFEFGSGSTPSDWGLMSGTWGNYGRISGTKGMQVTGDGTATRYAANVRFRAKPGTRYYAAGWMRNVDSLSGTLTIYVQQRDVLGNAVGTALSLAGTGTATSTWFRRSGVTPTTHADCYWIYVWLMCNSATPAGHRAWFDDIVVREALDVGAVVGEPDGARVQITPEGIEGYDSTPTRQFYIRATDGRAMFGGGKGVLDSAGLRLLGGTDYANESSIRFMNSADNTLYGRICAIGTGTLFFQAPQGNVYFQTSLSAGAYATVNCGAINANGALNLYHSVGYAALSYNNSTGIVTISRPLTVAGDLYLNSLNPYLRYDSNYLYIQNAGYAHQVVVIRPGGSASGGLNSRITMHTASASATPTYTETVCIHSSGSTYFNGGNVAIGRTDPGYKLHVYDGGNCQVHVHALGQAGFSIQNTATSANVYLPSGSSELSFWTGSARQAWFTTGGNAYKRDNTTTWSTTSDGALKRDVEALRGALGTIRQLRPVTYRWAKSYRPSDKATHVGFLAQEWAEVFPEYVGVDEEGHMTMNLGPLHEYLVAAIQEMDARLSALEARGRAA